MVSTKIITEVSLLSSNVVTDWSPTMRCLLLTSLGKMFKASTVCCIPILRLSERLVITVVAQIGNQWNEHSLGLLLNFFSYSYNWLLRIEKKKFSYILQAVRLLSRLSSLLLTLNYSRVDPWYSYNLDPVYCLHSYIQNGRSADVSILHLLSNRWRSKLLLAWLALVVKSGNDFLDESLRHELDKRS